MGVSIMPLSDAAIRKAKKKEGMPKKLFDEKGLYLLDLKYWRHKYRVSGKEQTGSYGVYPEVTLAEARSKRDDTRALLRRGINPGLEKRKDKIASLTTLNNTFHSITSDWLEVNERHWDAKHATRVRRSLELNVLPHLGKMPITEITPLELRAVLSVIQDRGAHDLASRVRQRCSAIFLHGMALGLAKNDPADSLKIIVKPPTAQHFAAIEFSELPEFLKAVEAYPSNPQTHIAFKLLLLTLVRTNELISGRWEEIDEKERVWNIPAHRMKVDRPHFVPLSRQSLALFQNLRSLTGNRELMFPSFIDPRKPMSNTTILRMIHRAGFKGRMTGHGFRTLGSTELNESGLFSPDSIERQLSHEDKNDVRAAYNRAKYIGERRTLMQWWADQVTQGRTR